MTKIMDLCLSFFLILLLTCASILIVSFTYQLVFVKGLS